jgi:hypothetical protein
MKPSFPKIAPTIANVVMPMMIIQSTEDPAIDAATRHNSRMFVLHIFVLLGTAVIIAVFTWLNWDSGNKLQDAIRQNSDLKLSEAKRGTKQLESANLKLADDLERQKERTALSEKAVLELPEKMADRVLKPEQRKKMLAILRTRPPARIVVQSLVSAGNEALQYAFEIAGVFREAGWTVTDPNGMGAFSHPMTGVILIESADMESQGWGDFISRVLLAGEVSPSPITTSPETRRGTSVLEIWVVAKPK